MTEPGSAASSPVEDDAMTNDRPASVSLEDWRFDTEGSLTHALCGSVYEVPPCSLTRLLALTEQHVCPEVQVIDGD